MNLGFESESRSDELVEFVRTQIENGNLEVHAYNEGDMSGYQLIVTEKGKREIELFNAALN